MIGIVDYGAGNLLSVHSALEELGFDASICSNPAQLDQFERVILPGVGAFSACMENLNRTGFKDALNEFVLQKQRPILGICLGMQAMARKSYEFGEHEGLGWFDAEIVRLQPADPALRVPQIGWNSLQYARPCPLFKNVKEGADVYFVHSYHMHCVNAEDVAAICDYGMHVTAAVSKDNIFATQFHPEKSQEFGLKILENFATLQI